MRHLRNGSILYLLSITFIFVTSSVIVSCGYGTWGSRVPYNDSWVGGSDDGNDNYWKPDQTYEHSAYSSDGGYTQALKDCDTERDKANKITTACPIQQYADEISRTCMQAFNGLYNIACGGLSNRLLQAKSYCSSDFQQYKSYLSSGCQSVLGQYM